MQEPSFLRLINHIMLYTKLVLWILGFLGFFSNPDRSGGFRQDLDLKFTSSEIISVNKDRFFPGTKPGTACFIYIVQNSDFHFFFQIYGEVW
jgi:hypothetical protein